MLKTVTFVAALAGAVFSANVAAAAKSTAAPVPASPVPAATPAPAAAAALIVGTVRDRDGRPVVDAVVEAHAADGTAVGTDRTDELGTFALALEGAAATVTVRCRYCEPFALALEGRTNLAIVVRRYRALESDLPSAADLAVLPAPRIADALGLVPFTLPTSDGSAISDRGLGGGRGLVLDDGAPAYDLATGDSGLLDFPDRTVRALALAPPSDAYRYGNSAGGGTFALDQLDPERSDASLGAGGASSLVAQPMLGTLFPAAGLSDDGGTLARRADLDLVSGFAGGRLRVGTTAASETLAAPGGDLQRNLDLARLAYATASRRYRTFVALSASELAVAQNGALDYRSSYLAGSVRVEHPGAVTLAFGANGTAQSGTYLADPTAFGALVGNVEAGTIYADARGSGRGGSFDAAFAAVDVGARETLAAGGASGAQTVLLPSLGGTVPLGGGFAFRASYSQSLRVPTLLEADALAASSSVPLERGELAQSALEYDPGGRVRGEAIAFREFSQGIGARRLDGLGASLVWQVAPLVSLRVWTLRDDPFDFEAPYLVTSEVSRQVLWATYANGNALRIDALVRRDVTASAGTDLDGDLELPLAPHLAFDLGSERRAGERRYLFGLRAR
ncbi:MAG: carboxypeptidase-like regulatory domain-containing protein [Vulcanimicrobiaceae bacterium]